MIQKNYAGLDGFVWWMGVVESRKDPLEMGRCQVRVFGWHSPSLGDIPSEDLPWAVPVNAVNAPTFSTPKEGDFVFGFFADGRSAQVPLIMGSVPSFVIEKSEVNVGFNDLRTSRDLRTAPKKVISRKYSRTGGGATVTEEQPENYPKQRDLGNPTVTGLARNDPNETHVVTSRKQRGPIAIPSADGGRYNTPRPSYAPRYPYNQALETESGHSLEFDDTPGSERVEMAHRSGTMFEIQPNGTKVEEVVRDNYSVVMGSDFVYVMGKAIVSVDKDCTIKVTGNMKLQVGGDLDISAAGDVKISSGKDTKIASSDDVKIDAKKTSSITGKSSARISSSGSTSVSGKRSTRVTSSGRMAISGISTSITSVSSIKTSRLSVAGKVSATGVSSTASIFSIPAFPALEAIASGIEQFAAAIPAVADLTSQLTSLTSLTDIQSLMSTLDVAQLDGMLELANVADINKLVGSLGGPFGIAQLVAGVSPMGMAALMTGLNPTSALMMANQLTSLKGDIAGGVMSSFMDKLPVGDISKFTKNLPIGKINEMTSLMNPAGVDKLFGGMASKQIKDAITSMAPTQVRNVLSSMNGQSLKKTFASLSGSEFQQIQKNIGYDLSKTINQKLKSSISKYPIVV
jgi:hypothetical protein